MNDPTSRTTQMLYGCPLAPADPFMAEAMPFRLGADVGPELIEALSHLYEDEAVFLAHLIKSTHYVSISMETFRSLASLLGTPLPSNKEAKSPHKESFRVFLQKNVWTREDILAIAEIATSISSNTTATTPATVRTSVRGSTDPDWISIHVPEREFNAETLYKETWRPSEDSPASPLAIKKAKETTDKKPSSHKKWLFLLLAILVGGAWVAHSNGYTPQMLVNNLKVKFFALTKRPTLPPPLLPEKDPAAR